MDTVFLDNLFLDEMLAFSSEEYPSLHLEASEEDSKGEDNNADGFLSTD